MPNKCDINVKQLLTWINEAQEAHSPWRTMSWEDYQFVDGKQWSDADMAASITKGVKPLTINRIFPIVNLIQGHYINNRLDIVAKGRTKQDNELGQVMSEGIQYVVDANKGRARQTRAFKEQVTTGFGCMSVGFNPDPRKEKVSLHSHPWYSIWWDPYASPWMNKDECRYAFSAEWSDLEDLKAAFPELEKEITEQFTKLSTDYFVPDTYDQGTEIEDYKKYLSSGHWVNEERKRVRPIEIWYTKMTKCWFALMPNGRVIDLDDAGDERAQYAVIQQANEVVSANVKKMRVATLLSDLLLQDCASPYVHDEYPFVPFVGYLDRYDFPFGIPRQIKEQDMEVNKRRSMALSLLGSRRVTIEKGAAEDENRVFAEANRQDGFIVMKKGKLGAINIQEMTDLAPAQMDMLQQSEREIQEVSGANDEMLGYETKAQTGVALERKQHTSATITASLLDNAKMSQQMMGERIGSLIQDSWTEEKVLRVTDRVTGAEKFVAINEQIQTSTGIEIKNDITQASFDMVITNEPMTDTMRQKNMELIFSAINKSPPEAVGPLLNLALEISDIPNKDMLLQQIRKVTGVNPIDDQMTQDERDERDRIEAEAKEQEAQKQQAQQDQEVALEQGKTQAETEKLRAETLESLAKADATKQDVDQRGWAIGQQAAQAMKNDAVEVNKGNGPQPKPKGKNNDVTKETK